MEAQESRASDLHGDEAPGWLVRAHIWALAHVPSTRRAQLGIAIAVLAAMAGIFATGLWVIHRLGPDSIIVAFASLFIVNYLGCGGALVPIPGLRLLGLGLIFSQGAVYGILAGVVGGVAMGLGQVSYFVAARVGREHVHSPTADSESHAAKRDLSTMEARTARAKARLTRQIHDHGFATILGVSLFPVPLSSFASATAGAMGMGFSRFLAASLIGRLTLACVIALIGAGVVGIFTGSRLP